MFEHIHFDISIERNVRAEWLRWPAAEQAADDSGLGGNRDYYDLRGMSWSEVTDVHMAERKLMERIEHAEDPDEEHELIEEELLQDPELMMGLDIGIASTVAALSAARCVPFASCNGGAFGQSHHESHPLVAFCARPQHLPLLMEAAGRAGVGLESDEAGQLIVYAADIRCMTIFAAALLDASHLFDALTFPAADGAAVDPASAGIRQPDLFD